MNKRGHGPIDYISKAFCIILGVLLIRFASDGVHMPASVAMIVGILLIVLSILAFFH